MTRFDDKQEAFEVFVTNLNWLTSESSPAKGWIAIQEIVYEEEDSYLVEKQFINLREVWLKGEKAVCNRLKAYSGIEARLDDLFAAVGWLNEHAEELNEIEMRHIRRLCRLL